MELNAFEHLIYGFVSGLTEILPVSERAHSVLLLKVLGAEKIGGLPVLLIHIAVLAAIYLSSQVQLVKMSRARRLARIPKKRRKRPLDIRSLMDSRFLTTMMVPVIVVLLFFGRISQVNFSLLAVAALLFLNGFILYIPQFLPGSNKDARSLSRVEGLLMGLGGCMSVLPGMSGLGVSVSVGSICGVERSYALNMTLMMNMAYLVGMIVYDVLGLLQTGLGLLTFQWVVIYILAAVAAFVSTMLAIRVMRALASGTGFFLFAYYCWGIALFAFILNLMA
ncbi:MAG: undecaprenyl-diphosphate phosphatase [Faecousia sp.]